MRQQFVTEERFAQVEAALPAGAQMPPRAAARLREQDARRQELLRRTFEKAVIPHLLTAVRHPHQAPDPMQPGLTPSECAAEAGFLSEAQVNELVDLLLSDDAPGSADFVAAMRDVGASPEQLFLDLLTPAARRLGVMWEEDLCDFSEVTIGLFRLHAIVRMLEPAFVGNRDASRTGPRALLVQTPGEQHGLGLAMVVQFFVKAGWNVWSEPVATSAELIGMVRRDYFAIIGISVGCNDRLDSTAADIRAIRRESLNRDIGIMVGGPVFLAHPQLAVMIGADATARDGRDAVVQAQKLLSMRAPSSQVLSSQVVPPQAASAKAASAQAISR